MTLAGAFPVEQILAVSNATHIYRSWRYRKKKEGKLLADYDSFWRSLGGQQQDNGNFALPLTMPRKPMEEIASKKRSEYRRRYTLLDSLIQQVSQATDR
ncbi:Virulence factor VirK [Enterobacter hormaechei]|nr:Virulence factor VirK [Enterobacter hormaechei]